MGDAGPVVDLEAVAQAGGQERVGEAERIDFAAHLGEQRRRSLERVPGADVAGREQIHLDPDLPPGPPLALQGFASRRWLAR